MSQPVLAVDVGGTKIAAALVDAEGTVLATTREPTLAFRDGLPSSAEQLAAQLRATILPLLQHPTLPRTGLRVGIGSAGPIDLAAGTVSPLNIPGWRGFPIVERVRQDLVGLGIDIAGVGLIGDGHCVALGEWWRGAAQGESSAIGCIVSTGVGAGVVIDGVAYQGRTGNAVHVGHAVVHVGGDRCACGSHGCVETYASGTSMVRRARAAGWTGDDMPALAEDARQGLPLPLRIIEEGMAALGAGLAGLAINFDVPTVVVGGGVAKAGDIVLAPLRRHFEEQTQLGYIQDARIVPAVLDNAGLLGAARIALTLES